MLHDCNIFFVALIGKFKTEVLSGYRIVRYSYGTCHLAGEILSLQPEASVKTHTTNFRFFPSSPLVVKGDCNFCT
jgi:hypothetical protein